MAGPCVEAGGTHPAIFAMWSASSASVRAFTAVDCCTLPADLSLRTLRRDASRSLPPAGRPPNARPPSRSNSKGTVRELSASPNTREARRVGPSRGQAQCHLASPASAPSEP
eukprot:scaffold143876_cov32-Tisochrysis_lutea.AAC.1